MTGGGPIVMATTLECSQDAILRFLTVRGGRATNRDLLEHFKAVWSDSSDPERRAAVREAFKGYVDAVAFVKKSDDREDGDGVKWVCLRKKYRRSVVKEDEEEASIGTVTADGGTGAAAETEEVTVLVGQEEGTGPDDVQKDGSRCENDVVVVEIMGSLGTPQQQPCATEARTKEEERTGEESATSGETHHHHHDAEVSPAGSGYGNDRQTRRGGETVISRGGGGTILVDNRNDQVVDCQQQQPQQQVPVIAVEEDSEEGVAIGEPKSDDIMGNALGFKSEKSSSGESVQAASREIPRIAVIEASPLPVAAADGSMFDLPAGLYHHCVCGGAGNDGSTTSEVEQGPASRRQNSTGSQHSLRSGHLSDDDDDECHSGGGGGSLSGSDNDNGAVTPRSASRQNFIELMMNNSPQVRRSMAHRNSAYLSRCNDGDSSSVASSSLAGDEYRAPVALDPLEHAWMMCASDGEWAGLAALLADEPGLLLRRDFVTGFTCLHWAAKLGRAELLALVVNFARRHQVPVDVDVRSGAGGYTPLHLAAMHGHVDVLKLLVGAYGADVEVRDYSGRKACQYLTDNNATIDLREIIAGASAERDSDTAADGAGGAAGGARRRLSNALVDVLNPLRLLHHHHNDDGDDEATDGQSSKRRDKPVRRKSSLSGKMRPKLQRLRDRTSQIVHSVSFHDAEDLRATRSDRRGGSFKSSRPKSNLFG